MEIKMPETEKVEDRLIRIEKKVDDLQLSVESLTSQFDELIEKLSNLSPYDRYLSDNL